MNITITINNIRSLSLFHLKKNSWNIRSEEILFANHTTEKSRLVCISAARMQMCVRACVCKYLSALYFNSWTAEVRVAKSDRATCVLATPPLLTSMLIHRRKLQPYKAAENFASISHPVALSLCTYRRTKRWASMPENALYAHLCIQLIRLIDLTSRK